MSELDKVIDQIESHAALAREQKLRAEIERLRECLKGSDMLAHVRGEQIERLRAALQEIEVLSWTTPEGHHIRDIARRALEGK